MEKDKVDFNYRSQMSDFFKDIQKTLVQQPDFSGIGMHGPADHGDHGEHVQTSIGMGNTTVNFRELLEK